MLLRALCSATISAPPGTLRSLHCVVRRPRQAASSHRDRFRKHWSGILCPPHKPPQVCRVRGFASFMGNWWVRRATILTCCFGRRALNRRYHRCGFSQTQTILRNDRLRGHQTASRLGVGRDSKSLVGRQLALLRRAKPKPARPKPNTAKAAGSGMAVDADALTRNCGRTEFDVPPGPPRVPLMSLKAPSV